MVAKLIGRTGPMAGREFVISDGLVTRIGARPTSEIRIMAAGVSREHARIVWRADGCWLEDAGSRNGTFICGLRVTAAKPLRHLDVVTLARGVDLIFVQANREAEPAKENPALVSVSLEFLDGPSAGKSVHVPVGTLTIGRGPTCEVVVSHPVIGARHATITRVGNQVTIEDLESANGTFVNERPIISLEVLKNGDRIALAGVVRLKVSFSADFGADASVEGISDRWIERTYDTTWMTRLVFSPTELVAIERNQPRVLDLEHAPGIRAVELTGSTAGRVVLRHGVYTIGRAATANIRLDEDDADGSSRVHAVLTVSGDGVIVEDRSIHGTYVNNESRRVKGIRTLRDGDTLRCGRAIFIVRLLQ